MTKIIGFIYINNGTGGSANVALQNIKHISKRHKTFIIVNKRISLFFRKELANFDTKIYVIKIIEDWFKLKAFTPPILFKRFLKYRRTAARLNKIFLKENPNVIHLHSSIAIKFVNPSRYSAKYILTIHETGGILTRFNPFYNFNFDLQRTIKTLQQFDILTSASENLLDKISPLFRNTTVTLKTIRNGIHPTPFSKRCFENINALFIGGSLFVKNIYLLLDFLEKIDSSSYDSLNFTLHLIGFSDSNLRNRIKNSKLHKNIIIYGQVNENKYIEVLAQCNIYFNVSYHETIPNSLMDAINYGLVPFVNKAGGNMELLSHMDNSICFNEINPKSFIHILNDKRKLEMMTNKIQEIKSKYDWEIINRQYEQTYFKK